ncbi:MAG TPA: type VI secretion system ATPase TssH [Bryobacteraceae bacterium]|nr:type VI secretion system ATPase TssH [Bryobacteraceae bacterium]
MQVNLRSLFGKLNPATRSVMEAAAGLCVAKTNYDVEVEHVLVKLLDTVDTDAAAIIRHAEIDTARATAALNRAIDRFKTGNGRTPAFSPDVLDMMTDAWTIASIDFQTSQVRTGFLLVALLGNDKLSRVLQDVTLEFRKISLEDLRKNFDRITQASREAVSAEPATASNSAAGAGVPGSKTPYLDQFTVELVGNARNGKIDPVLGRDGEIRQVIDILTRRRQNNPILVGEAGVGKTAIVEGLALRIAGGDVPPPLKNVQLRTLDLALLQAGAGVKGEFENRLKGLIAEVKASPIPVVLFIDEAHTMIGAGGQAGQNDAANLLKPALARGELRTIAATTWSEYKKYFEKDPALTRRFQTVKVDEPTEEQCIVMLRGAAPALEMHHNVRILDEGLESAVRLSHRYLSERQLPDKAISVLDTACARLSLGQNSVPSAVEALVRRIDALATQTRILEREANAGTDHHARLEEIAAERDRLREELAALQGRWDQERDLVSRIRESHATLEKTLSSEPNASQNGAPKPDVSDNLAQLKDLKLKLADLQGEQPMIRVSVDSQIIGEVISGWTGIPVGKMLRDEVNTVLKLESHLGNRVIGQEHALKAISQRIRTSKARLDDPGKPIGVFLLVGPSGVGKTETALALSDLFYGGEKNLITINMSEFQEAHTVSGLKGSPPGYVGYGEGGVLTEAVRRRPYSVVLLDEVEKAHPDVLELFFQVFDKGRMEDGEGREIDFKNTIIILTSNVGTDSIMRSRSESEDSTDWEELAASLKPELNRVFKPAFLGRLVVIPYYPIQDDSLKRIIRLKLEKIQRRLAASHRVELICSEDVVEEVAARCTEVESGARNVDNILTNTLLPEVSVLMLTRIAAGDDPDVIRVAVGADGNFEYLSGKPRIDAPDEAHSVVV